jgi:aminoglycoside phosphotransferase (APT) family kinase protein
MTDITDTIDELTPEWFTAALRETNTIGRDTTVTHTRFSRFGAGQLAAVIRAELTYDQEADGPSSVIVKQPSTDPGSRGIGTGLGMYRAEVNFYEQIAPQVGIASPRVYWSRLEEETGRFTLVIEDLSGHAEVGDLLNQATPEQVELALAELIRLQAPLWDAPWISQREWLSDLKATRMFFGGAVQTVGPFLDRFGDRMEDHQLDLVRRLAPHANEVVDKIWYPPFVVAHGDYRLDNMMFGIADGTPPLTLVDWQTTRAAPPGLDLAVFLATCVDVDARRATEQDLLQRWIDGLVEAGVRNFGYRQARENYRAASLYPFLICVATAVTLEQSERGDRMWAQIIRGAAELVTDTEADRLLL